MKQSGCYVYPEFKERLATGNMPLDWYQELVVDIPGIDRPQWLNATWQDGVLYADDVLWPNVGKQRDIYAVTAIVYHPDFPVLKAHFPATLLIGPNLRLEWDKRGILVVEDWHEWQAEKAWLDEELLRLTEGRLGGET